MYSEVLGSSATAVCLLHFDKNGALVTTMVSTRRQEVEIPACGQRRWTCGHTTRSDESDEEEHFFAKDPSEPF